MPYTVPVPPALGAAAAQRAMNDGVMDPRIPLSSRETRRRRFGGRSRKEPGSSRNGSPMDPLPGGAGGDPLPEGIPGTWNLPYGVFPLGCWPENLP
jgi:hypothetical protein